MEEGRTGGGGGGRGGEDSVLTNRQTLDANGGTAALLAFARQLRNPVLDHVHAAVDVAPRELEQAWKETAVLVVATILKTLQVLVLY